MNEITDKALTRKDIPVPLIWYPEPRWGGGQAVVEFAHSMNGYKRYGGDGCARKARAVETRFYEQGDFPPGFTLGEYRNALFLFIRADRHGGGDFEEHQEQVLYLNRLIDEIWLKVRR